MLRMKQFILAAGLLTALASCAPATQKVAVPKQSVLAVGQQWKYEGTVSRTFDITSGAFHEEEGITGVMLQPDSTSAFMTSVRLGSFGDGPRHIAVINVSGDQVVNTLCVIPYPVNETDTVLAGFEFPDTPDLDAVTTHYLKTGEHPTTDKTCKLTRLK